MEKKSVRSTEKALEIQKGQNSWKFWLIHAQFKKKLVKKSRKSREKIEKFKGVEAQGNVSQKCRKNENFHNKFLKDLKWRFVNTSRSSTRRGRRRSPCCCCCSLRIWARTASWSMEGPENWEKFSMKIKPPKWGKINFKSRMCKIQGFWENKKLKIFGVLYVSDNVRYKKLF